MRWYKKRAANWDGKRWDETKWGEMRRDEIIWDKMRQIEKRKNKTRWDKLKREETVKLNCKKKRRCIKERRGRRVLFWSECAVLQEALSIGMPLFSPLALTAVSSHQPLQEATTPHQSVLHGLQPCLPLYSSFSSQHVLFPDKLTHTHTQSTLFRKENAVIPLKWGKL